MYVRPTSTRLLRGMLIPAIRAMSLLALPLLVPWVSADHENPAVAADDLALLAHRLDRRSYLHDPFRLAKTSAPALAAARGCRYRARTCACFGVGAQTKHDSRGLRAAPAAHPAPKTPLQPSVFTRRGGRRPSRCATSR